MSDAIAKTLLAVALSSVVIAAAIRVGFMWGDSDGRHEMEQIAVAKGAGVYGFDQSGTLKFYWKRDIEHAEEKP